MPRLSVKAPSLITILFLMCFAAVGAITISPALPAVAVYFAVKAGAAQQVVALFLFGIGIGQLFYGPLSNRFGRKPAIVIGCVIALLGSLLACLAEPLYFFHLLLIGGFVLALGASVGITLMFTIINDYYHIDEARKIISVAYLGFGILVGISSLIAGLLVNYLGWESCFYALALYTLVLLASSFLLEETLVKKDPHALKFKYIVSNYKNVFKNKFLLANSLIYACAIAISYSYSAEAPFIVIHYIGLSAKTYGFVSLIPWAGFLLGSMLNLLLRDKWSANSIIWLGIVTAALGLLVLLGLFLTKNITASSLMGAMFIVMIGVNTIFGATTSQAAKEVEDKSNASAALSFIAMITGAVATYVMGQLQFLGPLILPVILLVAVILMVPLYFWGVKK